jgi:hypothetical protein
LRLPLIYWCPRYDKRSCTFATIRRMKPLRQIEAAEHMIVCNNFTLPFLRAILLVTKPEMLTKRNLKGRIIYARGSANAPLEREHEGLVRGLKAVESSFGSDILCLAVSLKYLERVATSPKIKKVLEATCPETALVICGLLKDTHAGESKLLVKGRTEVLQVHRVPPVSKKLPGRRQQGRNAERTEGLHAISRQGKVGLSLNCRSTRISMEPFKGTSIDCIKSC